MGSRSPQAVKDEITAIRAGLDDKITVLEQRLPPMLSAAKKIAVALAGGTGSGLLFFVVRRLRGRSSKRVQKAAVPQAGPVVQVLPRGTLPVAIAVAAIWAGVRLYEAKLRADGSGSAPADVRSLRRTRSAS